MKLTTRDLRTAIIGIFLSPFLLMSQQNDGAWTNIGPRPVAVEAIVVDPHGIGTVFIGTGSGGARKSVDGGRTWSVVTGLTPEVLALAIDASGPQTVYATGGGVFKSDDGGATWKNIAANFGPFVAADPNLPGVVYAGVFNNLANGSVTKSIDGGVTWTTIFPTTAAIFNITIDSGNSDILYVSTVGHGAFKSTDGGQHWSLMPALTPGAIWTLSLDPANSQVLYAGTNEDGSWKSTDTGNTWQCLGSPGPFPVYSLTIDPSAAHMIYAGTNGGGVWTSSDGGASWFLVGQGFTGYGVRGLAFDPSDSRRIYSRGMVGDVYSGTQNEGVLKSTDFGDNWKSTASRPTGLR